MEQVTTAETRAVAETPASQSEKAKRRFRLGGFWQAFKNFAIVFSFIVNFVLVLVLVLAIGPIFQAKTGIVQPLLDNLDNAFAGLGRTVIKTTVHIDDRLPVVFDLPLEQSTQVVLEEEVPLQAYANFSLGPFGSINGVVSLNLPKGMVLPVRLEMMVPVSTTVPVVMQVPVEIKLDEAGMGPAIETLRDVFRPLNKFVKSLPNSPREAQQQLQNTLKKKEPQSQP